MDAGSGWNPIIPVPLEEPQVGQQAARQEQAPLLESTHEVSPPWVESTDSPGIVGTDRRLLGAQSGWVAKGLFRQKHCHLCFGGAGVGIVQRRGLIVVYLDCHNNRTGRTRRLAPM